MSEGPSPWACVAGWPIAHSRSPLIHGFWLRQLEIAGRYERVPVPPGDFATFAENIGRDGLLGANVTVPHKENAFAACDRLTAAAADLGAVNTLWRENGALWGDNTDVAGFLANLDEQAPAWQGDARSAVVLGAGGAARAVVKGLLMRGVAKIAIVNRSFERAERLAAHVGAAASAETPARLPTLLASADLLVNATSLGMKGQPPLAIDLKPLPDRAIVADLVYVPLETPLLAEARRRGLRSVEGLGMLLHQAAPAFERWFGVRPKITAELRALIAADIASGEPR
ncbi:MAG TPA: shikimate dehydrogenase [Roseiarcus sp.]|nr:shikimate dehydrogenase [Roseiarcus sp.]